MKKVYAKMGQNESKQKLQQITNSINKIRKDVRNGKITANDVERIQEILQRYTSEIDGNLSKKVRASDVYTTEQLIEITTKELDALKQEVNLDIAAIPKNSFSRWSSKNYSKEKSTSVKEILATVEELRREIRNGNLKEEDYERLQRTLVSCSQRLSYVYKKNKKQEIDAAQKLISSVTEEVLTKQQNNPDSSIRASVTPPLNNTENPPAKQQETPRGSLKSTKQQETPRGSLKSTKQPEISRGSLKSIKPQEIHRGSLKSTKEMVRESLKSTRQHEGSREITTKSATGTLDDIESKLEALKNDIKVAEANRDKSRLHFLSKSIQTLMTDLQMVNVKNHMLNEQRKEILESNLVRAHQSVDKFKRQLSTDSDIKYLAELQKKEKRDKHLQDLDDIQRTLMAISKNLNNQNIESEKDTFNLCKNKLNSIEELNQDISLKKTEVFNLVLNVENAFTRLEMEDRLNQAEWKHFQYKLNLSQFAETPDSSVYKSHRQHLLQLRESVDKVLEISQKVDEKKKYVLYNIDNNIIALDQIVKQNQEKLQEQNKEEVVLRRNHVPKADLISMCKEIPIHGSPRELGDIVKVLNDAKVIIDQKLKMIQNKQNEEPEIKLVTIRARQLQPVINSQPPARAQLENIQKDVEALQTHIENSRYTKETQLYKDIKNKLESYKIQIANLPRGNEESGRSGENLVKYIDNVLLLLENNISSRKSTTEDMLVDIMSVSTRVNELGSKIQAFNYTIQDYGTIKSSLLEHQNYLKNLKINRTSLGKSRDDILHQIDSYLSTLEDLKKNEKNNSAPEEEKRFNQDLRKLKEKVNRYSGTYRNVLYKTIENDLDKHLNRVDMVFTDANVALKVKQDIENSKMILEQKSNKDQHYNNVRRDVRPSPSKELTEVRENVESVKRELSQSRAFTKEELDRLDARLTLSIVALDNIKDDHSSPERDKLYQDISFYFAQIQELMLISRQQTVFVEDQFDQQQMAAKTIASIETELEQIKPQILTFVGTETNPDFLKLDEILVRGTLKLDELDLDQTSQLHHLKLKLMREIHKYSDILDDRINQTEEIEKLEKEVNVMLIKIDSFNGYFGDSEYTYLDEQIIKLKVSLGKLSVNQDLIARREACIKEVDGCMKKLKEAAKTRTDVFSGTLV